MDVNCPRCGEPFDLDEFHYLAEDHETTYAVIRDRFFQQGCNVAVNGPGARPCAQTGDLRALHAYAAYEVNGDDVDGIASDLNML